MSRKEKVQAQIKNALGMYKHINEQIEEYCLEQGCPVGACSSIATFQRNTIFATIQWALANLDLWISVEDALPNYRTDVLCHYKNSNKVSIGARIDGASIEHDITHLIDRNGFLNHGYKDEVDLWMPIRKPKRE